MSALVAHLARDGAADSVSVRRALAASPHRGDVAEVITHGRTVLGVNRLQGFPETSVVVDGDLAVAFCGVLDDREQVRMAVTAAGSPPAGDADAALVAAAFRANSGALTRTLDRFRGTYAAVVSNGAELWAFRDHLGFRPLFYAPRSEGVWIATEISQVLAGADMAMRADRDMLHGMFYDTVDEERGTAVQGVFRLRKAAYLHVGERGERTTSYWNPDVLLESWRPTPRQLQERFDAVMDRAARRALTDASVISLSGGIDSPTVAGYAAPAHWERYGRRLPALSIVAPRHPSVDESPYIDAVRAFHGGLPGHTYEQEAPAVAGLERWVALLRGPVPTVSMNEIEEHYRRAAALGYTTVITGEFAEFLVDRPEGLLPYLLWQGRVRPLARHMRRQHRRGRPARRIAKEAATAVLPRSVVQHRRRRQDRRGWTRADWLDERSVAAGWRRHDFAPRHHWRVNHVRPFVGAGVSLEAAELCQTLCGVRVRRPWFDVDVIEFFLSLPAEEKYRDGRRKSIVRDLARERVPEEILERRDKTVFDESIKARMDYGELKRWLINPAEHVPGVDYEELHKRLEAQSLTLIDYRWARDLAALHAFLSHCDA